MSQTKAQLLDGKSATIQFTGGSASAPSVSFTGDTNTGIYSPGADQVAISTGGSGRLFVDASGNVKVGSTDNSNAGSQYITVGAPGSVIGGLQLWSTTTGQSYVQFGDGTASADHYRGYMAYLHANDALTFGTASTERLRIDSSGRVGIGTSSPSYTLDVAGTNARLKNASGSVELVLSRNSNSAGASISLNTGDTNKWFFGLRGLVDDKFYFYNNVAGNTALTIDESSRVGIGTTSPGSIFDVKPSASSSTLRIEAGTINSDSVRLSAGGTVNTYLEYRGYLGHAWFVDATERARIDSSGRLLVGTSSSASTGDAQYARLQVQGNTAASTNGAILALMRQQAATAPLNAGDLLGKIDFTDSAGNAFGTIFCGADGTTGANDYPGRLVFSTTADGASSPTERMRIGQNGYIQCSETGTYSPDGGSVWHKFYQSVNERCLQTYNTAGTFTNYALTQYIAAGGGTGSGFASGFSDSGSIQRYIIFSNGNIQNTNNSYGAISDLKLKENIVDASEQWNDIKNLRVRKYNLKQGGAHTQIGVIAQEIELVSPGLVYETTDRDTDGNDLGTVTKNVNYSVLYMKAVKALQEAMERIETLEAKVAALESA